ncbi:hypothetical protein FACS1894204_11080 [Synergistales bacterium]|nr:hypothetical protein FACS1894204_11080 [Synergistales bacterium]
MARSSSVKAKQKWNDKWPTFLYAANYHYDLLDANALHWAIGFVYRYNPNVQFSLAYGRVKADDEFGNADGSRNCDTLKTSPCRLRRHPPPRGRREAGY